MRELYPQGLPENRRRGRRRSGSGRSRLRLAGGHPAAVERPPVVVRAAHAVTGGRRWPWPAAATPRASRRPPSPGLGGMKAFVKRGDDVIVKPNICIGYHGPEYAATTNPDVVGALVGLCLAAGAGRVRVMDSPFGSQADEAYSDQRHPGGRREGRRPDGDHGAGQVPRLHDPRGARPHAVAHLLGHPQLRRAHRRAHRQGSRRDQAHAGRQEPARRDPRSGRHPQQHRPAHGRPGQRLPPHADRRRRRAHPHRQRPHRRRPERRRDGWTP